MVYPCCKRSNGNLMDARNAIKPRLSDVPCGSHLPLVLDSEIEIEVPPAINQFLRPYQQDGVKFLYEKYSKGIGAILGDEMGLGKTIQVIALLSALLRKKCNSLDVLSMRPKFIQQLSLEEEDEQLHQTFLVIAPASVLDNWADELDTWGNFAYRKYHGSNKDSTLADVTREKLEIVLTTFATYRLNTDSLNNVSWDAVFVDEVHKIKELNASTSKALQNIPVKRRYGLTGTPIQNNMAELWTILNWSRPGCLGSLSDFTTNFISPIERGQCHNATKRELATARTKKSELQKKQKDVILRRTKSLIKDELPRKNEKVAFCKLSEFQLLLYQTILNHPDVRDGLLKLDDPCSCGSSKERIKCCLKYYSENPRVTWSSMLLNFMHLLLKTANHAALLVPAKQTAGQQTELINKICTEIFSQHPHFFSADRQSMYRTLSHPEYCGKMKVLQKLLSFYHLKRSKVLLFSYSVRMLDILEQYIIARGYNYRRLDGSVTCRRRFNLVKQFNHDRDIFVCLISTKCGSLGLNLTGANVVIIFDPNWNPSHDVQAQDRVYRIGQKRDVRIYRLISAGTIEENIYLRQVYKQQLNSVGIEGENARRLFDAVRGNDVRQGEIFGVKNLFSLRTGDACLTSDILQRNDDLEAELSGIPLVDYISPPSDARRDEYSDNDDDDGDGGDMDDRSVCENDGSDTDHNICDDNDHDLSHGSGSSLFHCAHVTPVRETTHTASSYDILDECGVVYSHASRDVIGGSKAEDYMTKCAVEDVLEFQQNSQLLAAECPPSEDVTESSVKVNRHKPFNRRPLHNDRQTRSTPSHRLLIGQTPKVVKRQQFRQMCQFFGFIESQQFAQHVIRQSVNERIQLLNDYYAHEVPGVDPIFNLDPNLEHDLGSVSPSSNNPSSTNKSKSNRRESALKVSSPDTDSRYTSDFRTDTKSQKSPKLSPQQSFTQIKHRKLLRDRCKNKTARYFDIQSTKGCASRNINNTDRIADGVSAISRITMNEDQDNVTNTPQYRIVDDIFDNSNCQRKPAPCKSVSKSKYQILSENSCLP